MLPLASDRPLTGVAESVVVALAVAGDRAAFAELVRRRQLGIRRFMRQLCRNETLADDLAQQVFLRMWRSLQQLGSLERFNGWLKQLMVSVWLDELRRYRTTVRADVPLQEEHEPAARRTPALEYDLEHALAALEPRARLCVVLAYSEGHSHEEIATLLHIPLGTAKSLVTRSAAKLRTLLRAYASDPDVNGVKA
jgi:RNA polymerase sigma-70 factor (ECF subfamily)